MTPFFWVAVVIGSGGRCSMTIFVAVRFRERPGEERSPVQTHGNVVLEVSWTIIPFLILAVMAVPTVATIFNLAKIPKGPDVVHVDGRRPAVVLAVHSTPTRTRASYTANEMHIPVGQPVVLTLTSNNVIHSFWVPELAGKKDVVPGHPNTLTIEADHAGTFTGQCAEYCGLSHANMRLRVIAQTQADYDAWVQQQQAPLSATAVDEFTKKISGKPGAASSCHSVTNRTQRTDKVGVTIGPNLTHVGDREAFAGDIYDDDPRQPLEVGLRRARPQARRPPQGLDAELLGRRHDPGPGARHREVPAVRHRHQPHGASGVPLT